MYYAVGGGVYVCGRLDRRDQEIVRGSVSFERVSSDQDPGNPEKISISWDLRRTKKRGTREVPTPKPGGGTTGTPADLDITVAGSTAPVPIATKREYILTVTNNGPGPAPGTVLTYILPAGMTLFSSAPSQGTCSGTGTVTCRLGTLAKDASVTVVFGVGPKVKGIFVNRARVVSSVPDPDISNNNVSITVRGR